MLAEPYLLVYGDSVYAKVKATNSIGSSEFSVVGNGAVIITAPDPPTSLADDTFVTDKDQVGLTWFKPTFEGGSAIEDYTISYAIDDGNNNYSVLASGVTTTSYTDTTVVMGTTYLFKVQARSAHGISDYSNILSVLIASKPSRPSAPTTVWNNAEGSVTIQWTEPTTNGGTILSYEILIRKSDGVSYSTELTSCDGSDSLIVSSLTCSVPDTALVSAPFLLPWGSKVYAKISATNAKGSSSTSNAGNGAIIINYPDPPVNV